MALKVLQLLPAMEEGGVERGTVEVCRALVAAGHEALVVSAGGRLQAALDDIGATHISWSVGKKSPLSLRWISRLRALFEAERIDVVHARSRLPAWLGYLAWKSIPQARRPRFVTTVHGFYSVTPYSTIMTRGERVIAVSNTIRDYIFSNYPQVDMNHVEVIHRGVDDREYPRDYQPSAQWLATWRQDFPELVNKYVVALPGRLRRLKGHEQLLDLIARLRDRHHDLHGLIIGDDTNGSDYIQMLKRTVEQSSLPVSFTGYRSDLKDIYTVVDVVLSLSTQPESFGRTVLEPLCLGTPVIGYHQGGVGEILDAMYPQGAVAPGDTEALASRVSEFIADTPAVTCSNAFLLSSMQSKTLALYQKLCRAATG